MSEGQPVPAGGPGDAAPGDVRGQMDTTRSPRFSGPPTFGLLPRRDEVSRCDVVIAGVPFDSGTSYRPGARFGPNAVRQGSRLLRPYHPGLEATPFDTHQVADAGDIACNPFNNRLAFSSICILQVTLRGNPNIKISQIIILSPIPKLLTHSSNSVTKLNEASKNRPCSENRYRGS